MKGLFIFLLFISMTGFGQLVNETTAGGGGNTTTSATASISYSNNTVHVVCCGIKVTGGTVPQITLTCPAITYYQLATVVYPISGNLVRLTLFVGANTSGAVVNNTATIGWGSGVVANGWQFQDYNIQNLTPITNGGLGNIRQVVTLRADSTANPTFSFPGAPQSTKNVLMAFSSNTRVPFQSNPYSGTPPTGWTESEDAGWSSAGWTRYAMYRTNTTDKTNITITALNTNWALFAVEAVPGVRRRTSEN